MTGLTGWRRGLDGRSVIVIPGLRSRTRIVLASLIFLDLNGAPAIALDCALAKTDVENAICSDPEAATADAAMGKAYSVLRSQLSPEQKSSLKASQATWIASRDKACSAPGVESLARCLAGKSREREGYLAGLSWVGVIAKSADATDDFKRAHAKELSEMVKAAVPVQNASEVFEKKFFLGIDPASHEFHERVELSTTCYFFAYAKFYFRYHAIIDQMPIDKKTKGVEFVGDKPKNVGATATVDYAYTDPVAVVIVTKQVLDTMYVLEGYREPASTFALEYANNPDLEKRCAPFLKIAGLDN